MGRGGAEPVAGRPLVRSSQEREADEEIEMRLPILLACLTVLLPTLAQAQRRPRRPARQHRVVRTDTAPRAHREVVRAREHMARTAVHVRRGGRAGTLVDSARDLLGRADRALAAGRLRQARDLSYRAQRLLTRADEAARRAQGRDAQVRGQLDELDLRIARAAAVAAAGARPRAAEMVRLARDNRAAAVAAFRRGDRRSARRHLRAGSRAALEVVERWGR